MPQALRCANTSRLRRETHLQRWIHRSALAPQPTPVLVFSLN
ncbi:MAG: hypothetical protein V7K40_30900 [Nostoc sp.]